MIHTLFKLSLPSLIVLLCWPLMADSVAAQTPCPTPTPGNDTALLSDLVSTAGDISANLLPTLERRVNIVLLGSDKRATNPTDVGRTDAILLVTVDPASNTAGVLSIPRDLWVFIPGRGYSRINTAYQWGEALQYPGGGTALVLDTIRLNFAVPVDYYLFIDFASFTRMVDVLDGVAVCVPQTLDAARFYGYVPTAIYPAEYYSFVPLSAVDPTVGSLDPRGYEFLYIEAGYHMLDGATALRYARSRASNYSDFDRIRRQQAILWGIRARVIRFETVRQIPDLWPEVSTLVDTNLQLLEVVRLAQAAAQIPATNIQMESLGANAYTAAYVTPRGEQVLLPRYTAIYELVYEMFF